MEEELENLKEQLRQKDHDLQKAAKIGKALLDENSDLKTHTEDIVKQYSRKVEKLEQELYGVQLKLSNKENLEAWYSEEIGQLKHEQQKRLDTLREDLEVGHSQAVSKLQRQISELQFENEKTQNSEFQLQEKVLELEDLVHYKQEQSEATCKSFSADDSTQLHHDFLDMQNENTSLKSELIGCKTDGQRMTVELEKLRERLRCKDLELEEVQCQSTSYINSLENARMEIMDLKVQMDALRMESSCHSKKGNSLFSEVEDRRVEAEKKLISNRVHLDALKDKYEMERQHHHKLKMQMVVLLQMSRGGVDSKHVTRLESKLSSSRDEVRNLTQRIQEMENTQKCKADVLLEFQQRFGNSDSTDYAEYLITLLKSKEEEIVKLNSDLNIKSMQLLDEQNKTSINDHRLFEVENEREKYHAQGLKLTLQVQDLLQKYEPDSLKSNKPVTMNKEKIPLPGDSAENTTLCIKETTLNKSHRKSVVGDRKSVVGDRKSVVGDRAVIKDVKPLVEIELNKEPICPAVKPTKSRAVHIADSVTVVDSDGHAEKTSVSENTDKKKLERSRPKGRVQQNMKQVVIPENAPSINECKSQ